MRGCPPHARPGGGLLRSFRNGLLLAVAGVLVCGLFAGRAAAQDPRDLDALRGRIERLKKDIADAEETRTEARDQLRESERSISEANRALRNLAAKRESVRTEIRRIGDRRKSTESEIAGRREQLRRLLVTWYVHGEAGYVRLLLSGEDPNRTARDLHYLGYLSAAEASLIRSLRADAEQLTRLETETRDKSAELVAVEKEQKSERDGLLRQKSEHKQILDKVSSQIRDQKRQVKSLERDEQRMTRLIERLTQALAAVPPARGGTRNDRVPERGAPEKPFMSLKGGLRLPIRGDVTNRYGTSRAGGGPTWKGLFIRGRSGEEVRAVAGGRVVFADWMRGFGNLLILDHGQGYLSIYGNNESVLKAVGDPVRTGDVVATVGASGGNLEAGLYFEMRHEGKAFDPMSWVKLR